MNAPKIPNPQQAAIQGTIADVQNYPFEYLINALSQEGGAATVGGQTYDFTGLGTADVQNQMSDQMAQTLLDIQNGLGPQFIAQRLADLKQSDPQGYAARQQLFDSILQQANTAAPNTQLATDTQTAIANELNKGGRLDQKEIEQVQQQVRGDQIARGNYLGNAPAQQEAEAVVNAGDQMQAQRQGAAGQFLSSGVSPSDIEFRKIQQDLSNLGSFLTNQTPTAEFGSLSGAQSTAAPTPPTGYTQPTLNLGASAGQGINNAFDLYSSTANFANNQVNPFTAGLSTGSNVLNTAFDLGYSPWSQVNTPAPVTDNTVFPGYEGTLAP